MTSAVESDAVAPVGARILGVLLADGVVAEDNAGRQVFMAPDCEVVISLIS